MASGLGIEDERTVDYIIAKIPAEIHGRAHVNFAAPKQPAELAFQIRKPEKAGARAA
jgi:hypothetical protein